MWDVKRFCKSSIVSFGLKFYLNYVGCKAWYRWLSEGETAKSFTLTMWDVKFDDEKEIQFENESFTLTMWDVKSGNSVATTNRLLVLP